jgi:hypothetical protein
MENLQSILLARSIRIGEGPTHLSLSARGRAKGGFLPRRHWWLPGKIRPASGRWSAVEWPGSKPAGWWTGLVAEERGGAHQKASLCWRGSATVEGPRQARVGVTGGVRAVGEGVLSGAMLGVELRWSERGWSGLSMVAQ